MQLSFLHHAVWLKLGNHCGIRFQYLQVYDRTPNKDGPVNQHETIIEGARPKIWNVYVRRKKMGNPGKGNSVIGERMESVKGIRSRRFHPLVRSESTLVLLVILALLSMPPKMYDRVDALEERLLAMEVSVRETLGEFRQLMLEELTKLRNEQVAEHRESPFSDMDSGAEYRMAAKKVELPSFDGTDPMGWITRAETYFEVQGSTEEVKVRLAKLSMERATIHWFNPLQEAEVGLSWTKLKRELIGRYGGRISGNPFEDVDEYLAEFEYISSQVSRLPEEQYLGYFIGGVRTFNPMNRLQVMRLARDVEAEVQGEGFQRAGGIRGWKSYRDWGTGQGEKAGSGLSQGPHLGKLGVELGPTQSIPTKPLSVAGSSPHESRSMTQGSCMNRKAQGLCFRCGEKYHPLHRCTERQLRMVVLADDETVNEAGEVIASETQEEEDDHTLECGSMGLFAEVEVPWGGRNNPTTLRIEGLLNGVTLGELKVDKRKQIGVRFGDGHRVSTAGKCEKLDIQLGEFSTTVEPYVLELGDVDMILGVSWLRRFGKVTFDWEEMTLSFCWQDKYLELQGQKLRKHGQHIALMTSFQSVVKENSFGEKSISKQSLSKTQVEDIQQILVVYAAVFQEPQGLPPCRNVVHFITLHSEAKVVSLRPYQYPYHLKEEIEKQVGEMLKQGIIRPSSSAFSSPVILVKKKDGSWRMCVDYRELNKDTIPDKYPFPVVEELLDELHAATYFSKLDLKFGYHQIRMVEKMIHEGHYEFLVMPFGLTNALATFQSTMNQIFKPYLRKFVLVFFDDILVYSKGWDEHLKHLMKVFELLCEQSFMVNRKKCVLGSWQVEYLGHLISEQGVVVDPEKIKSVINWPIPHNVKGVSGFLGLTGYYRKFITGYGKIAQPLTELTKKDGFHWGIGAVLMQDRQPIAYFSKALAPTNVNKSAYEKELMALVLAVQHERPYLIGRSFKVYSDQKSLRHLLHQKISTEAQQNWLAKLLGYQFEVIYKPGPENKVADSLSRMFEARELREIQSFPLWLQDLQRGVLFYKGRLVLSAKSDLIPTILNEFHSSPVGGHSGFLRTYKRIAANLYWTGMKKMIQEFVKACDVCQQQKYEATSPAGLLQPLLIPDRIWEDISLDFIKGLPKSKEIVRLHGIPQSIVSDRDPVFMSLFWHELFRLQGTTLKMSYSYHPETDGQTEVPKNWSYWVPWAELWIDPFEIVYGRTPPALVRFTQGETRVEAVAADLQQMKKFADKKRRFMQLEVGEWVFIKLRPHRQLTIARRINQKLTPRYYGPFLVVEKKGEVSYKAIGNHVVEPTLPTELSLEEEDQEEPETMLATKEIPEGGTITKQWLVKWKGRTEEEATWEDEGLLRSQFPYFSLEDKAVVAGGSNDRTPNKDGPVNQHETNIEGARPKIWNVYVRRKKMGLGKEREESREGEFCYRRENGECEGDTERRVILWLGVRALWLSLVIVELSAP
ncbi:hypothetical protein V8G54_001169 [Vigna mungo]|uniref:RNA-directed DNA polymerase n=1 Tax=Vigna mungo TaxID=3915 RepID=A0AAQ3P7U2_VIGMU